MYFIPVVSWTVLSSAMRFAEKSLKVCSMSVYFYYLQASVGLSTDVISVTHKKFGQMLLLCVGLSFSSQI